MRQGNRLAPEVFEAPDVEGDSQEGEMHGLLIALGEDVDDERTP